MPTGETVTNLQNEIKFRLRDNDLTMFSNTELNRWINQAERDFGARTQWARQIYPVAVTAEANRVALPADTLRIYQVLWLPGGYRVAPRNWDEFMHTSQVVGDSAGSPTRYTIEENSLYLYPAPSASSRTAQINDATGISATDTTIDYDTVSSGAFETDGYIKIGSEIIAHHSSSSTQFKNCERGVAGTTAATGADNAVITELDLAILRSYIPATVDTATGSNTTKVDKAWTEALVLYSLWKAFEADHRSNQAAVARTEYLELIRRAKLQYDNRLETQDNYQTPSPRFPWSIGGYDPLGGH